MSHINNGDCLKCNELFDLYPDFHEGLRGWFKGLQERNKDAHISCAGRNKVDQEAAFKSGTSRAHFGQSAHNYNAAVDIFRLDKILYDPAWFKVVVKPNLTDDLVWFGETKSKFYELAHVEVRDWRHLVAIKELKLVLDI